MTFNISRSSTIVLLRIYSFVTTNCAFTIFITINLKKLTNETIIFKNFVYSSLNYAVNLLNNFTHEFKFDIIKLNSSSQISSSTFFHDSRQWIKKFQSIQFLPIQNKLSTQSKFLFRIKSREDGGEGWFVRVTNPHKGPIDDKTPISWAARWPFVYGLQRGGSASKAMRGRLDWPV